MLHNPVTKWMNSNIVLNVLRHAGFEHTCKEMILHLTLAHLTGPKLKVLRIYKSLPTTGKCIPPPPLQCLYYFVRLPQIIPLNIWRGIRTKSMNNGCVGTGLVAKGGVNSTITFTSWPWLFPSFRMNTFTPHINVYHSPFSISAYALSFEPPVTVSMFPQPGM